MSHLKRITPLRIVDDIEDEGLFYEAMGAERVETGSPDCVGYKAANDTGVILSSMRSAISSYGPFVANMLAQSGALYMHVEDIDNHINSIPEAKIIARNIVDGVEEAVIDTDGNLVVLAHVLEMAAV